MEILPISSVDLPIQNGDFPVRYVNVYQRLNINSPTSAFSAASTAGKIMNIGDVKNAPPEGWGPVD